MRQRIIIGTVCGDNCLTARSARGPRIRALRWLLLSALLTFPFVGTGYADELTLRIIAINDFHGNLLSPGKFRADAKSPELPAGGVDVLAGYVTYLKKQAPNSVVVSAGDLIGASPLVSALFHDEGTIETMNLLGLEISAVGNHEFDKGSKELLRLQKGGCSTVDQSTCEGAKVGTPVPFRGAKFQYLAANVLDQRTSKPILPAYTIKTYSGVPVAFIGLTLQGTAAIVTPSGVAGLRFADEASTINEVVRELRTQGVESFVVLIHQGGQQTTKGTVDINSCEGGLDGSPIKTIVGQLDDAVDLVVSGHTHAAYICRIPNRSGREIPVTSAASYGRLITNIDLTIDNATKRVTGVTARNLVVDRSDASIVADSAINTIADRYATLTAPIANRVVGAVTADITTAPNETGESALGDLIADAQLEATHESGGAVVALMNAGGIRALLPYSSGIANVPDGKVTYGELFTTQPFGNSLVTMTLTGAQLKTLLEEQFRGCALGFPSRASSGRASDQILQISDGFSYTWDPTGTPCSKVDANSIKIGGVTVVPKKNYRVTVNSFLADGGNQFFELERGTERVGGPQDLDALSGFIAKHASISPSLLVRIKSRPVQPAGT
jgi:5'-nucleotidase